MNDKANIDVRRCFQSTSILKGGEHRFGEVYDHPNGCFVRWEDFECYSAAMAQVIEALRITSAALESQLNDPNASLADGFAAANVARAALARVTGAPK